MFNVTRLLRCGRATARIGLVQVKMVVVLDSILNYNFLLQAYNYAASLTPMQYQVPDILPRMKEIAAKYDKVIAVGYSQGGLIWRAMIEEWDNHNVELFISLASPQHGVYGGENKKCNSNYIIMSLST